MKYCHLGSRKKKKKKKMVDLFSEAKITASLHYKRNKPLKPFFLLLAKAITLQLFQVKHSEIIFLSYLPCFRYYILENRITHINIIICNRQSICFFGFKFCFDCYVLNQRPFTSFAAQIILNNH